MDNLIQKKIELSYCFSEVMNRVIALISDRDEKLEFIHLAAKSLAYNATTGKYVEPFLERELIKIAADIDFPDYSDDYEKNTVLHVLTEAYNVGGHTRAVREWIDFDAARKHSVFMIRGNNTPQWFIDSAVKSGGRFIQASGNNHIELALNLYETAMRYEKIILHVHPDEIVHILAFGNNKWKKTIYFNNHCEIVTWLGVSVADVVLDFTNTLQEFSRQRRCVRESRLLPLPLSRENLSNPYNEEGVLAIKAALEIPADSFVVMTLSRDHKMTDYEPYNFLRFCEEVVKISDNVYYLIVGNDMKSERWLNLYVKSEGKIRPLGELDKANVIAVMAIADFYVDSFVYSSNTCILEALSFGLPTITLKTIFTQHDTIAPIAFDSTGDMIDYIARYIKGEIDFAPTMREISSRLEGNYGKAWLEYLDKAVYSDVPNHAVNTEFLGFNPEITEFDLIRRPLICNENAELAILYHALEKLQALQQNSVQ
jgi:hypothetical protein